MNSPEIARKTTFTREKKARNGEKWAFIMLYYWFVDSFEAHFEADFVTGTGILLRISRIFLL
jgi:hypothetical protein